MSFKTKRNKHRSLVSQTALGLSLMAASLATRAADVDTSLLTDVDARAAAIEQKIIGWRRDIHQHPELGNREFRTSRLIADHLRKLGLKVQAPIAHTGVVALLEGGKPGPVVALRADIDALPITEQVDLPFASKVRTTYNGEEVGVMHACGHDGHTAALLGVAEVLAGVRARIPGTVKFIFQPAEEGAPRGEEGGAQLLIKEGALLNPRPEAIFAIHFNSGTPTGRVLHQAGPSNASVDNFFIKVHGQQVHGARPWEGVDSIVVASQIVLGIQTIVSRQVSMGEGPTLITIGTLKSGVRTNIVADLAELSGTIRSYQSEKIRADIHSRLQRTAEQIAASAGAKVEVEIDKYYPSKINDPELTQQSLAALAHVFGEKNVIQQRGYSLSGEDFAFYANEIPGLQVRVGSTPAGNEGRAAPSHSSRFFLDESALLWGARTYAHLALEYLQRRQEVAQ